MRSKRDDCSCRPIQRWRELAIFVVLMAAGCATQTRSTTHATVAEQTVTKTTDPHPANSSAVSNTDPCATRMHDISGAMLMYYALHNRLPAELDALRTTPGGEALEPFTSPASGRPFLYNPVGVIDSKRASQRLVLYESAPTGGGFRWAITIVEPTQGQPLVARVVAIPEAEFAFMGK